MNDAPKSATVLTVTHQRYFMTLQFLFAPKGLYLKAQGCRFGYPGKLAATFQPQGGCDHL